MVGSEDKAGGRLHKRAEWERENLKFENKNLSFTFLGLRIQAFVFTRFYARGDHLFFADHASRYRQTPRMTSNHFQNIKNRQ
jgi:hypothetical protein